MSLAGSARVLHLIPTLEGGGAERQLAMLAAEQARRGYDVHVGLRRTGVNEALLRDSAVDVHLLGDNRGFSLALLRRIDALMHEISPDVVQTWLAQMDIVGGLAARRNRLPWVVSERVSERAFSESRALWWLRSRLVHGARAVVANSKTGADYWRRVGPPSLLVRTVANAVDVAAVRAAQREDDPEWTDEPLVLVVGRLTHQKAVEVVLEALALMPARQRERVRVLVIGEGPLREDLERQVQRSGLISSVRMLPYRSGWWGLLKRASVLVSMSRYEGHPNVVLETIAAGCPVIVSDIPEHREFLDEHSACIVPREDARALAAALSHVLERPAEAQERAARAARCVEGLTVAAAADAYAAVYGELIDGRLF